MIVTVNPHHYDRKMPIAAAATNSLNITERKKGCGSFKVKLMSLSTIKISENAFGKILCNLPTREIVCREGEVIFLIYVFCFVIPEAV